MHNGKETWMKAMMQAVGLAAVLAVSAGLAVAEEAAPPAATAEADAQLKALREQQQVLRKKMGELKSAALKDAALADLAQKSKAAREAFDKAVAEKLAADPANGPLVQEREDVAKKVRELRRSKDEAAKAELPKLEARAAELEKQYGAKKKEIMTGLADLSKASEEASKAQNKAVEDKLAQDPAYAGLKAEMQQVEAKLKELLPKTEQPKKEKPAAK
jgi:chromosome segregation ATPase